MRTTAEVVIIGGGIQGISLAYHLARQGVTDVRLIEMNTLGSGPSGRSASVTAHSFIGQHCLQLVMLSFEAYMRFGDELGADPGYTRIGFLALCGEGGAADLRRSYALLQRKGVQSELLDRPGIAELTPGLNLEDIELGLYTPRDGVIDAHSIMMAYARAARRLGVDFAERVKATGLEIRSGRVVGVRTTAGLISAGRVVNAAGFRARQVAAWTGMELPITNSKRHIFVTGPVPVFDNLKQARLFRRHPLHLRVRGGVVYASRGSWVAHRHGPARERGGGPPGRLVVPGPGDRSQRAPRPVAGRGRADDGLGRAALPDAGRGPDTRGGASPAGVLQRLWLVRPWGHERPGRRDGSGRPDHPWGDGPGGRAAVPCGPLRGLAARGSG